MSTEEAHWIVSLRSRRSPFCTIVQEEAETHREAAGKEGWRPIRRPCSSQAAWLRQTERHHELL